MQLIDAEQFARSEGPFPYHRPAYLVQRSYLRLPVGRHHRQDRIHGNQLAIQEIGAVSGNDDLGALAGIQQRVRQDTGGVGMQCGLGFLNAD